MLKHVNQRLQFFWCLLAAAIVIASLLPHFNIAKNLLGVNLNWPWVHFMAYLGVSILPVMAWKFRIGLTVSLGGALTSLGLEILRGHLLYGSVRTQDIVFNLLGVAAGILLGLNILTLRSHSGHVGSPGADVSRSSSL
jgi:hypothetical protein